MANLPDNLSDQIYILQRQLLELIYQATITDYTIFESYGETENTMVALEQVQNVKERARTYYTRLYRLLLQIYESIRVSSATMELLEQSLEETKAIIDAGKATIQETKRDFNL
jgi:hypothetical protein